jgi:hypothetical protein
VEFVSDATKQFPPKLGRHHIAMALFYPGDGTSGQVIVSILGPSGTVLGTARIDKVIRWPTKGQRDFDLAYSMIDRGRTAVELVRELGDTALLEALVGTESSTL